MMVNNNILMSNFLTRQSHNTKYQINKLYYILNKHQNSFHLIYLQIIRSVKKHNIIDLPCLISKIIYKLKLLFKFQTIKLTRLYGT